MDGPGGESGDREKAETGTWRRAGKGCEPKGQAPCQGSHGVHRATMPAFTGTRAGPCYAKAGFSLKEDMFSLQVPGPG